VVNINSRRTRPRGIFIKVFLVLFLSVTLFALYKYRGQEALNYIDERLFKGTNTLQTDTRGTKSQSPLHPLNFIEPNTGIEFVFIKGGCYQQGDIFNEGDSDERPVHEACVGDFYIGKFEVTQDQWFKLMKKGADSAVRTKNIPMQGVSWKDAQAFLDALKKKSPEHKFRLPTEAEWEYVCRGGGKRQRYSGTSSEAEISRFAWTGINSQGTLQQSGTLKPNELGIHDLSGSLWEWVEDDYKPDCYQKAEKNNPVCMGGVNRVIRGGSFLLSPQFARCTARGNAPPLSNSPSIGFRVLKDI
jgi:formylglycine-generating enzyme required for sulfatase activity